MATRVFGTLLTWMEEKVQPVRARIELVSGSGQELRRLRKGRLDEIFFVDLPSRDERMEVFRIHISRRRRAPADYDLAGLARATEGFSGAELEEVVVSALYEAFASPEKELKTEHLLKAAREIKPLSQARARDVEALRQWAATNCRLAAELETAEQAAESDGIASRRARMVDL